MAPMKFRETLNLLRPTVASLGFALFLAVNATGTWGGVFPFLPLSFQTQEITSGFFMAQSLALTASFILAAVSVYFRPELTRHFFLPFSAVPYFLGWACLVGAIYIHGEALALAIAAGVLLGIGSAGFFVQWQRYFAGTSAEAGTHDLIVGTGLASLLYFFLYAIPRAVTAYLIPAVFLPLFALAAVLKTREIDQSQAMFEDIPRENAKVYRAALRDYLQSALCVGALGFCAGIVRSLAMSEPATGTMLNAFSMGASLIAALSLLIAWNSKSIRLNVVGGYRIAFPFVITAFVGMPFFPESYEHALAAVLYAVYNVVILLMMVQCAQASRDRGINPIFIYGFFAGLVYSLHNVGFMAGSLAGNISVLGIDPIAVTTIVAIYLLAMMHFAGHGGLRQAASENRVPASTIELVALNPDPLMQGSSQKCRNYVEGDFRDLLSKRMQVIRNRYQLSARETEVAELVARGNTVAKVAEELVVSENTIRTHMRRLYAKLGIHKKQELLDLLEEVKASEIRNL